jgi:hypothetical protein
MTSARGGGHDVDTRARARVSRRWRGELTSRPLPVGDETIDALCSIERARLAQVWTARSATERRVADSFAIIAASLRSSGSGAGDETVRLAERAIDDELRHAEICRVVASRFHGGDLPAPAPLALAIPRLEGASTALRHTLYVVGQCAINETTASAFLEVCRDGAEGRLARAALSELLSDEIDHARIGWMHLTSLDAKARTELGPWLLPLARANIRLWRETPRPYDESPVYTAHGAPTAGAAEGSLVTALRDLMIPGFARLGLPTARLEAWVAAGAPA